MQADNRRYITKAFVLSSNEIDRLYSLFGSLVTAPNLDATQEDRVRVKVVCRDGLTFYPKEQRDLLGIENVGDTEIVSIKFSTSYRVTPEVSIEFDSEGYRPIQYSVSGEDVQVISVSKKLDKIIELAATGYGWITIEGRTRSVLSGLILPITIFTMVVAAAEAIKGVHRPLSLIVLALGPFFIFERKVLMQFFPIGQFEIGRGKYRIEKVRQNRIQYGIGSCVAVVLLGILVNLISHKIGL